MLQQATSSPFGQSALLFSAIAAVVAVIAWLFQPLIIPLIISFVMYALLESYCSRLISHGLSQTVAACVVVVGLIIAMVALILIVLPVVFAQLSQLQSQLPLLWDKLMQLGQHVNVWLGTSLNIDVVNYIETNVETNIEASDGIYAEHSVHNNEAGHSWLDTNPLLVENIQVTSASLMAHLGMAIFLIPLVTFFLLKDFRVTRNTILGWLPNSGFELGWLIYYRIAKQLQCYLQGLMIQSCVVASITIIGFYLMGLELAFLYGLFAGLLNIIPYLGPILAMLVPMLIEVSTGSLDVWLISGIFSIILLAQVIDNIVVVPSVIAGNANLHPLFIVLGVIVFGFMFGIAGMLLAVPALVSAKIIATGLYCGFKRG